MEVKEVESNDLDRQCQAVSPNDEPCVYPATVHCAKCGRWFCDSSLADSPLLAGPSCNIIRCGMPDQDWDMREDQLRLWHVHLDLENWLLTLIKT